MSKPTPAPGSSSLNTLLSTLTTTLHAPTYVFIHLPANTPLTSPHLPPMHLIQMLFHEPGEGLTLITTLSAAEERGLEYTFPCKMITLDVQSSLEAVGFMAVIAARLAAATTTASGGMAVNPVSGFLHDYLFVPLGREEDAVRELKMLAEESKGVVS